MGNTLNSSHIYSDVNIPVGTNNFLFYSTRKFDTDSKNAETAMKMIKDIAREIEAGEIYDGVVTKIMPFGAFVDLGGGKEGLLHISKISSKRVEKVEDLTAQLDADDKSNIGDFTEVATTNIRKAIIKLKKK